jgi:hypothetical protein
MNTEVILNSYISPVYVTATNMIVPLASISLTSLYEFIEICYSNVAEFASFTIAIIKIILFTTYFVMKQSVIEISSIMSDVDKILLAFLIYNIGMFAYENYKLNSKVKNLKIDIEQLQKNISYFKKTERMREEWEQIWAEEVREYYTEQNNKYNELNKELNKEIKKLRKEMNQYA